MAIYYITGLERGAGATALAASLAATLKEQGRKAGYFKPVAVVEGTEYSGDPDTSFCRAQLGLDDPVALAPRAEKAEALKSGLPTEARATITQRWPKISTGKDAMFVEGVPCSGQTTAASADLATLLDARVIVVARYRRGMDIVQIVAAKERFGGRFAGVVLNAVAPYSQRVASEETKPALEAKGVRVLGIIPEDRVLVGFSVADYSKTLGGRILNSEERAGDIVENLLVGALL
ncbi:MAG: AAA family ATPase, partial [Chloroflexi bacterium]|nr:AAA family ATPase [Chloroflexota bacterium]